MKYKPDDEVVITCVPERAAMAGVSCGMPGRVLEGNARDDDLCKVQIGDYQFWWSPVHMQPVPVESSKRIADTRFVNLGPDLNSMVYWIRKLVHADCGDDAVRALAELSKIEKQIPG